MGRLEFSSKEVKKTREEKKESQIQHEESLNELKNINETLKILSLLKPPTINIDTKDDDILVSIKLLNRDVKNLLTCFYVLIFIIVCSLIGTGLFITGVLKWNYLYLFFY